MAEADGGDGPAADPDRTQVSAVPAGQSSVGHSLPGRAAGRVPVAGEVLPAREVGRYQVVGKLGEGAMATVYKAYDPGIGRALVIKFLHADLCIDSEYRQRFLREAKAAGALSHPNIVTVYDVGEIEGRPYIAMELLAGGPLSDQLKPGAGWPVREVVNIGIQVAEALDYAHQHGVVHRDIKPSNLLRLNDGRVKVADFGIAHMEGREMGDRTRMGAVLGTPHYMSPEQTTGEKVDGRSDLFSLGVVLYQLLAGRRPFEADSMVTLALRIARSEPEPLAKLRPDAPPALRRVVERCLKKSPAGRFSSGAEAASALRKVLAELDEDADRSGHPRRIPLKFKLALAMAALVALTMGITSAFVIQRQYQAMLVQALGQGASLTKMIAVESAQPALSDDWVGIDVFVQEAARALELPSISVIDREGRVRVSTDPARVGQAAPPVAGELLADTAGVRVERIESGGEPVFAFEAPVSFQTKRLGLVRMEVPEAPLAAARRQTRWLLFLLAAVTVATVGFATYALVERYSRPLRLLRESLGELAAGRYGYRIAERRGDEFGEVYRSFDSLAEALERSAAETKPAAGDRV